MQFLSPTIDIVFRKLFASENSHGILISFLNAILNLPAERRIVEVKILNPYLPSEFQKSKYGIVDVKCKDAEGKVYIVEMQVEDREAFDKRILFYASKTLTQQIEVGEDYFVINPVIFIGVLDFEFTQNPNPISYHKILDTETGENRLSLFQFCFVELPKFNKKLDDLETPADKWIYFLKHADELRNIPSKLDWEELRRAFGVVERMGWTPEEYDEFIEMGIARRDRIGGVERAVNKAVSKALKDAEKKAQKKLEKAEKEAELRLQKAEKEAEKQLQKAQQEALIQLEKAEKEKAFEIARQLLSMGMTVQQVCDATKLSEKEVLALIQNGQ